MTKCQIYVFFVVVPNDLSVAHPVTWVNWVFSFTTKLRTNLNFDARHQTTYWNKTMHPWCWNISIVHRSVVSRTLLFIAKVAMRRYNLQKEIVRKNVQVASPLHRNIESKQRIYIQFSTESLSSDLHRRLSPHNILACHGYQPSPH